MSNHDRKVAIITGGSQGIGAGLVAEYRRRDLAVVATPRTIKPDGDPAVLTIAGDISEAAANRIIGAALGRFGRIDPLVNNAGVYTSKPFTNYTAGDYAAVVGVNLIGFFTLTQCVIVEMLKRGEGDIVNVATTLADYANSSTSSVWTSLTKDGLASATKSLAIECASPGARVELCLARYHPDASAPGRELRWTRRGAPPREGQVRDIVDGILFLESSLFITGEVLQIDDGQIGR